MQVPNYLGISKDMLLRLIEAGEFIPLNRLGATRKGRVAYGSRCLASAKIGPRSDISSKKGLVPLAQPPQ
jgi:hypothetical protein